MDHGKSTLQHTRGNPWERASFLSRIFFWWVFPYFVQGYKRDLNEDDLYDCALEDTSEYLGDALQKEWVKEVINEKSKKIPRASLKRAVLKAFGKTYALSVVVCLFEEGFARVLQPVCLGWVVRYFSYPDSISRLECYLAGAGVCLMAFVSVVTHHPLFFSMLRTGMKVRVAACTLIYRKALKLSHAAMGKTTVGQMVNLLSNDVNRFDQSVIFLPYLVVGPIQTVICVAVLWQYLGISCLAGLVVLVLLIPLQSYSGKLFSKLRSKTAALTDERIRLMNEIISGMRVIKMYTWEYPFAKLVDAARKREIRQIRFTSILRGANIAIFFSASKVIVFICFITYVLQGHSLTAEIVFVSMTLYGNLRLTMTLFFPFAIGQWAESAISLQRIQRFLELEEQEESSSVNKVDLKVEPEECGVWMDSVSAKWTSDTEEATLREIAISVEAGELLAVVGPVGAGKSSLLMTILGELPSSSGEVKVRGKVAYSSQEPWVFTGTVQQNVTFGSAMDNARYKKVLEVCALDKDVTQFPYGDQSLVGERGVSLSGGQKARVNLARTLYKDADIYLLDDPLSAVDITVARHLFDKCINGYLKNKARILVTHQIQFLKMSSKILVLKEGKMVAMGSFNDLVNQGVDIVSMLAVEEKEKQDSPRKRTESVRSASVSREDLTGSGINFRRNVSMSVSSIYESVTSLTSYFEEEKVAAFVEEDNPGAPKQVEETRAEGSVKGSVYWKYVRAGAGPIMVFFFVFTNVATQFFYTGSDYWLALWTNAEELKQQNRLLAIIEMNDGNETGYLNDTVSIIPSSNPAILFVDGETNVIIYTGLVIALFFFSLIRTVLFFLVCMRSSIKLHDKMFRCITRAPIAFFDNNPIGRILNRFTKDLGSIDELLSFTFFDMITIYLALVSILGVVIIVSPWLTLPTIVLAVVFVLIRRFYIRTARDIKRLEGSTRSPVFSHISTSLYGITTIRAFGVEGQFEKDFCSLQDTHTSSFFILLASARWFGVVLDLMTVAYISCVTVFLLALNNDTTGGNVGLAISSALMLTGMFQWGARQSAELENQMTAVERVLEYSKIKPEAELEASPDKKPPPDWPREGAIVMKDFSLTYPGSGNVPVLKNLNCHIKGGEKVGIVGRTGAGKSSIIAALFRMTEPEGTLTIDGVKAGEIGLHDLRSKISIIPQDPVLFTGPIRRNIDPFNERPDKELWTVLEEVQLKEAVTELSGGLDNQMSEGGGNFSVGQRQLVCLARALLRRNKILVLDEATANVDHRTDALIQNTIRDKFRHCTVLTIAHRLNTVMDSDQILVLDAGKIMEFDTPLALLENRTSRLSEMVKQTGPSMAKALYEIAKESSRTRHAASGQIQNGNSLHT